VKSAASGSGAHTGLALLGLGLLLSIVLRVPYYQHSLIFVDEGIYAATAAELVHGKALYREVWCNHMPLAVCFCKWMFQLFGTNSAALHLGSLLLALLESLLLYLIGSRFFSRRIGGLAALGYAVVSANFYTPRIIGYTPEQLTAVFATSAVYFFLRALGEDRPDGYFWAGFLPVAAAFSKPSAVSEVLMFAPFALFWAGERKRGRALFWLASGTAAGAAVFLGNLCLTASLDAWWTQSVLTRVQYVRQVAFTDWIRIGARQPFGFGLIYLWLWILIWSGRKGIAGAGTPGRFLWLWLAAAFAGVAIGRRFYANYYIQVFPVLSLMAAAALDRMLQDGLRGRNKAAAWTSAVLLALVFLWFQARTAAHWYFLLDGSAHQSMELWDMCVIDRNLREVSERIRTVTEPEDRIFVWGPSPEFYFLSGCRMATAYPFFNVMDNSQPPYGDEEQNTLRLLAAEPPALIVDHFKNAKMANRPGWKNLLAAHYRLLLDGREVRLYLRVDKTWPGLEPRFAPAANRHRF
jgi:4-amino-4-deoxy-L-arabinose transferase-like glycosyltransferase